MWKIWVLLLILSNSSCSHTDTDYLRDINSDVEKIVDIIKDNYSNLVEIESEIPFVFYPASLKIKSKNFSSLQFEDEEKLYNLCLQQKVSLIYICSLHEIWLEIDKDDDWVNAHRTLIGKVINKEPTNFEINYYQIKSLDAILSNWYQAKITFSLVN